MIDLIRAAQAEGRVVDTHVIGIAASMASALACAGSTLRVDNTAFLMLHLPWTVTSGNAIEMRKTADQLDLYRDSLISIYLSKFNVSRETMREMLEAETWIRGESAPLYSLDAEIVETGEPLRAAAFGKKAVPKFLHTPKALKDLIMDNIEEKTQADAEVVTEETNSEETPVVEDKAEETVAETAVEVPSEETIPEEMIPRAEADKRVSGMQSTMAKKLDALRKDYEARITDFENQLKGRDEELAQARADATRLTAELETAKNEGEELSKRISALTDDLRTKTESLAKLNQAVLTPNMETPKKDWRNLKGKEFFDFLKAHPELAK